MNICEFIQEKIAIGEFDDNVSAHLRICHECKAFADDLERFLSCDLPDAGEPPKHVDDAIRTAGHRAAAVFARGKRAAWSFRILIPAAAMLAVCFLSVFVLMTGRREAPVTTASVPDTATQAVTEAVATVEKTEPVLENVLAEVPVEVGDWTGAAMDGELTQVTMVLSNSMDTLSLSDTDLLLAQLEADFAAYAEN